MSRNHGRTREGEFLRARVSSARRKNAAGQVGPAVACPASLLNDGRGRAAPPYRCPHAGPGARRERREREGGCAAAAAGKWKLAANSKEARVAPRAPPAAAAAIAADSSAKERREQQP